MNWTAIAFWNNTLKSYLIATATVVGIMLALWLVRGAMIRTFSRRSRETEHDGYDFMLAVARRTLFPLMLVVALYAGKSLLTI